MSIFSCPIVLQRPLLNLQNIPCFAIVLEYSLSPKLCCMREKPKNLKTVSWVVLEYFLSANCLHYMMWKETKRYDILHLWNIIRQLQNLSLSILQFPQHIAINSFHTTILSLSAFLKAQGWKRRAFRETQMLPKTALKWLLPNKWIWNHQKD